MEFNVDDITPEEEEEMFQQLQKIATNSTLMSRRIEVDWSEWTNLEYLSETIIAANPRLFGLPADYPCNIHRSLSQLRFNPKGAPRKDLGDVLKPLLDPNLDA